MLNPVRIDTVLDVLSQLECSTVLTVFPNDSGSAHIGVRELPSDPRCAGAGLFGLDLSNGFELAAVSFSGSCSAPGERPDTDLDRTIDGPDPYRDLDGGLDGAGIGPVGFDGAGFDIDGFDGAGIDIDAFGSHHVRVDALVTADGEIHSQVHRPDGPTPVPGPAGGVVIDALHRVLAIPVPGQAPPLIDLVAGMWFHQVMRLIDLGSDLGWAELAAAHLQPDRRPTPSLPPPSEEVVAASIRRLAEDASWEHLRTAAAIGRLTAPELDPHEADWMDATMFGRWMVDSFPSFDSLAFRLSDLGADDALRRISAVMARLAAA